MIKLDLTYLQNSIQNSKYDFCEAGSVKSVNRRLGGSSGSTTTSTQKNSEFRGSDNAFKVKNKTSKLLPSS